MAGPGSQRNKVRGGGARRRRTRHGSSTPACLALAYAPARVSGHAAWHGGGAGAAGVHAWRQQGACTRGAIEGADGHLIPDEEMWFVADSIPNGTTAAILLLEHLWAIPLRNSIVEAGGVALTDEWIHPADLVAIGLEAAAQ